jgi:hypothetical protein
MDINRLKANFSNLDHLASKYVDKLNEIFSRNWGGEHTRDSIKAAGEKASAAAGECRDRLNEQIDPVCDMYLNETETGRGQLRAVVADFPNLLKSLRQYMGWCQRRIKSKADTIFLRRALAAAALEDNRVNYREMYLALGSLYEACVKAGLQPSMEFAKVGELASRQPADGFPMRDFLTKFEDSAFFKADVEPKLLKL